MFIVHCFAVEVYFLFSDFERFLINLICLDVVSAKDVYGIHSSFILYLRKFQSPGA